MGILLVPYPARGHIGPFLKVGAELVRHRAAVRMVVPPRYRDAVRAAGVVPVVAGSDAGAYVPPGWAPADLAGRRRARVRRRRTAAEVRAACDREIAEEPPELAVVDPHARWLRGLPFGGEPAWLWTTSPGSTAGRGPLLVNGLPEFHRGHGRWRGRIRFAGPLHGGLRLPAPGFPYERLTGHRVLVVSFGTVFARRGEELRMIAESFRGSDWTVVLATGPTPVASLGRLPGNVLALPSIPQQELLRRADVLVTHGGMNSVLEAGAAGVPMLIAPRSREQRRTAATLIALGAGVRPVCRSSLRRQAESLVLDPRLAAGVDRLRSLIRASPSAAEAAEQVLELAAAR
ncbi:glycosyltransferase [Amycolatopsis saalfeldensis]|nr:nucleotide disphospho-sugar-binding domain-containing protein [Amycolatopsis saalfeldensis]